MQDFNQFNCVGCHAANAGGGMGPALSEGKFIYGLGPANVFLSIYQGRPNGMPAWGELLPESTIWELVAYVESIAHPPSATFGETISRTPSSPAVEQTPAEFLQTPKPWSFTSRFSNGRQPVGE
jgi:cytochrome c oxidase cbb3-type subunit 3